MTLKARCEAFLMELANINEFEPSSMERWQTKINNLQAFVIAEMGRTADERLDDNVPLALYFTTEADREEFVALIMEAKPGMISKRWPR